MWLLSTVHQDNWVISSMSWTPCCHPFLSMCPTLILGDMNIHLDNPNSADFRTLVHSFDLQQVPTSPTHKAGKELDLIFARNCTTDHLMVTPLHLSVNFFICFNVLPAEQTSAPPPMVLFHRNLRNLSSSHFSSLVSYALPPLTTFSLGLMKPDNLAAHAWILCVHFPPDLLEIGRAH